MTTVASEDVLSTATRARFPCVAALMIKFRNARLRLVRFARTNAAAERVSVTSYDSARNSSTSSEMSTSILRDSGVDFPDSSRTRSIALSAICASSSMSLSHIVRSSSFSTNSALRRMRVIGVRRSCPAAATRRIRLSMAALRREDRELSALAVTRTSAGPVTASSGKSASGRTNSIARSSRTRGLTIRLAKNRAIAIAPHAMSASHITMKLMTPPGGGRSVRFV